MCLLAACMCVRTARSRMNPYINHFRWKSTTSADFHNIPSRQFRSVSERQRQQQSAVVVAAAAGKNSNNKTISVAAHQSRWDRKRFGKWKGKERSVYKICALFCFRFRNCVLVCAVCSVFSVYQRSSNMFRRKYTNNKPFVWKWWFAYKLDSGAKMADARWEIWLGGIRFPSILSILSVTHSLPCSRSQIKSVKQYMYVR